MENQTEKQNENQKRNKDYKKRESTGSLIFFLLIIPSAFLVMFSEVFIFLIFIDIGIYFDYVDNDMKVTKLILNEIKKYMKQKSKVSE